jgi:hypothetical protein
MHHGQFRLVMNESRLLRIPANESPVHICFCVGVSRFTFVVKRSTWIDALRTVPSLDADL